MQQQFVRAVQWPRRACEVVASVEGSSFAGIYPGWSGRALQDEGLRLRQQRNDLACVWIKFAKGPRHGEAWKERGAAGDGSLCRL